MPVISEDFLTLLKNFLAVLPSFDVLKFGFTLSTIKPNSFLDLSSIYFFFQGSRHDFLFLFALNMQYVADIQNISTSNVEMTEHICNHLLMESFNIGSVHLFWSCFTYKTFQLLNSFQLI